MSKFFDWSHSLCELAKDALKIKSNYIGRKKSDKFAMSRLAYQNENRGESGANSSGNDSASKRESNNYAANEQGCPPFHPLEQNAGEDTVSARAEEVHQLWLDRSINTQASNSLWLRNLGRPRSQHGASMASWREDAFAARVRDTHGRADAIANGLKARANTGRLPLLSILQMPMRQTESAINFSAEPVEEPYERVLANLEASEGESSGYIAKLTQYQSRPLESLPSEDEFFGQSEVPLQPELLDDTVAQALEAMSDSPQCDALFCDTGSGGVEQELETELPSIPYQELVEIGMASAEHPESTETTIRRLAHDSNADIRYAVAENANISQDILLELLADQNPNVAERARKTLQQITKGQVIKGDFGVFQQRHFPKGSNSLLA